MKSPQKSNPPKLLLTFFKWFCHPDYHDDIEGDLLELYIKRYRKYGSKRAAYELLFDIIKLFRPGIIRPIFNQRQPLIYSDIFKHNMLISFRGFLRHKSTFAINIFGLSIGLACVLLIYLWIDDELKVDAFHEHNDQLYQVMFQLEFPQAIETFNHTPVPLAKAAKAQFPEIEEALCISSSPYPSPKGVFSYEDKQIEVEGIFSSDNFFKIFSFELIQGDVDKPFSQKNSVLISESLALSLFPSTKEAEGQIIGWKNEMFEDVFQISGIFKDPPPQSSLQFNFIFPIEILLANDSESAKWYSTHAETFLVLRPEADIEQLNQKLTYLSESSLELESVPIQLFLKPFSQRYLYNHYENGKQSGGRITYIKLFSLLACFILLIAGINYVNLATARASLKMKEIGVKKVIGTSKKELIYQFLGESLLVTIFSLLLAIVWVMLVLPEFNTVTEKHMTLALGWIEIGIISAIILGTAILAGSYPAFYLSAFHPIDALKRRNLFGRQEKWIRKGLIVLQFSLAIIFIVGFIVIYKQLEYTQNKHLGYSRDHVISFYRKGQADKALSKVFLTELQNIPGVVNAASVSGNFIEAAYGNASFSWDGIKDDERYPFPSPQVNEDFIETMGIKLKEGRSFSRDYANERYRIIINQAAADMMGMDDPVGKMIKFGENDREIIGLVDNFHFGSIHKQIHPCFIRYREIGRNILVKIHSERQAATIQKIEQLYENQHVGYPFEFSFLDHDYQALYKIENKMAMLSRYFTVLAIIISCLGLLGLAAYTAERRQKEIGIRKVLGANMVQLIQLLTFDFTKIVLLSAIIALPLSHGIVSHWLERFAYRIPLQWEYFFGAGTAILLITSITVSFQAIKSARLNPVECLRDE